MSTEGNASTDAEVFVGGPNSPANETGNTGSVETSTETPMAKTFDEDYVKSLREEAAKHRTEKQKQAKENEALLARLKEFEDAQLSESERSKKDFEDTRTRADLNEARAREAELSYQLALAARGENIVDLKAAVKLADRGLIEYGDSGSIMNLADVVENLRTEYPSLFNSAVNVPNTGVTNPAKAPAAKKYTRADLAKMSPQRIVELQDAGELNHLLRGNK